MPVTFLHKSLIGGGVLLGSAGAWYFFSPGPTLNDVDRAIVTGNIQKAIQIAHQVAESDPGNDATYFRLGLLHEEIKDYHIAAMEFEKAFARNSNNWNARQHQAFCTYQTGLVGEAEDLFKELLAHNPDDEEVQTELQWLLFNQLRERELEVFLESILDRHVADYRVLYHLLISSQRRPNPRESVRLLESIQQAQPGQPEIEAALAHCYWKLGEREKSRTFFNAALRSRPHDSEIILLAAEFEFEDGHPDASTTLLRLLADGTTNNDRVLWLQAQHEQQEGRLDSAIQRLKAALQKREREIRYYHTLATWLNATNQTEEASTYRQLATQMSNAEQQLYIAVSRNEITQDSCEMFATLSQICGILKKYKQSKGWLHLADRSSCQAETGK